MAWPRWIVRHASRWAAPSAPSRPGASRWRSGRRGCPAPWRAVRRAASGYHWSQQIRTRHAAEPRVERPEPQVARGEVELLVVAGVVGDVHLAVDARQAAVGVDDRQRVVVEARGAALEDRRDHHDAQAPGHLAQGLRSSGRESARPGRNGRRPRAGRSTATGRVPAGRRPGPPAARPPRPWRPRGPGSRPHRATWPSGRGRRCSGGVSP